MLLLKMMMWSAYSGICSWFRHDRGVLSRRAPDRKDGCVHEGFIASRQGLPMIPALAETVAIAKYLLMIEATGVQAHFGLLSSGASVELIKIAKNKGLPVTADVAMHQLHLTEHLIDGLILWHMCAHHCVLKKTKNYCVKVSKTV